MDILRNYYVHIPKTELAHPLHTETPRPQNVESYKDSISAGNIVDF